MHRDADLEASIELILVRLRRGLPTAELERLRALVRLAGFSDGSNGSSAHSAAPPPPAAYATDCVFCKQNDGRSYHKHTCMYKYSSGSTSRSDTARDVEPPVRKRAHDDRRDGNRPEHAAAPSPPRKAPPPAPVPGPQLDADAEHVDIDYEDAMPTEPREDEERIVDI